MAFFSPRPNCGFVFVLSLKPINLSLYYGLILFQAIATKAQGSRFILWVFFLTRAHCKAQNHINIVFQSPKICDLKTLITNIFFIKKIRTLNTKGRELGG